MAFLVFAVVASAVGIAAVLMHNRRPTTMQSSIGDFERGLRALAPVPETGPEIGPEVGPDPEVGRDARGEDGRAVDRDVERVVDREIADEIEAGAADARQRDQGAGRTG